MDSWRSEINACLKCALLSQFGLPLMWWNTCTMERNTEPKLLLPTVSPNSTEAHGLFRCNAQLLQENVGFSEILVCSVVRLSACMCVDLCCPKCRLRLLNRGLCLLGLGLSWLLSPLSSTPGSSRSGTRLAQGRRACPTQFSAHLRYHAIPGHSRGTLNKNQIQECRLAASQCAYLPL